MTRVTFITVALLCFALAAPAQAQTYATITAHTIPGMGDPSFLTNGSVLEIIFWVELDDRGGTDSGLAGMDLTVSWNPAEATLNNLSEGDLYIGGGWAADNDVNLDSDGDWGADYYSSVPPGPGVQYHIEDMSTETYIGIIPATDGVAGTNLWPNKFEVTPGAGTVFLQGYQDTPADFSIASEGSPYPWAHLSFTLNQDLTQTGLCLDMVIDTLGQLNSPTNTVDRILFAPGMVHCGQFPRDQAVSTEPGEVNRFMGYPWVPEPSAFLLAALGLPALLALRRRKSGPSGGLE